MGITVGVPYTIFTKGAQATKDHVGTGVAGVNVSSFLLSSVLFFVVNRALRHE